MRIMTTYVDRGKSMDEYVENFIAENAALKRKLQSKAEALLILSKELDQYRTQRDQFKLMAEQLQDRYSTLKKKTHDKPLNLSLYTSDRLLQEHSPSMLAQLVGDAREQNKALKIEVEDLKQKLSDAQGDIKVLRGQLSQQRVCSANSDNNQVFPTHQREELVQQLETLNLKCMQMEHDFQAVLDEKEELVTERDAYKCKVHRLNFELNALLKGDKSKVVDIDALVMENRYLQDRLHQLEEEKDLASQSLVKYKSMLEKKKNKGTVKLGSTNNSGMVMSHKQVQQLLEKGTSSQLPNTAATLADMKSLCLALLEALSDKTLALSHQKKANRILANRITELEHCLETIHGGKEMAFPSQYLLEGYTSSEVDKEIGRIIAEEKKKGHCEDNESVLTAEGRALEVDIDKLLPSPTHEGRMQMRGDEVTVRVRDPQDRHALNKSPMRSSLLSKYRSPIKTSKSVEKQVSRSKNKGESICVGGSSSEDNFTEDSLPPELQKLVQKALEEMQHESEDPP